MKYVIVNGLKVYPFKIFYPESPYAQFCMFCNDLCFRLDLQNGSSEAVFRSGICEAGFPDGQTESLLSPYLNYEFNEAAAEICHANWNDPIAAMLGNYLVLNFSGVNDDGLAARWAGAMDKMISALSKGTKRFCMDETYVPVGGISSDDYPQIENRANFMSQTVRKLCGIYDTQNHKFLNITDVIERYCQESSLIENPDRHILMKNFGSSISHCFTIEYTEKGAYLYGNYQGEEKIVKLPDYYLGDKNRCLEGIDKYVFYHSAAEEIIFPEGLKHIDILEAYSLKRFNIPEGCVSIKLKGCSSIEEFNMMPLSLKEIEILSCDKLTSLMVPESVEKIKLGNGCSSIKNLIINSSDLKKCEINLADGMIENIEFNGKNISIQQLIVDRCNHLTHIHFGTAHVKIDEFSSDHSSLSDLDLPNVLDKSKLLEMAKNGATHTPGCKLPDVLVTNNSIPSALVEEAKKALKESGDFLCAAMLASNFTHPLFSQDLDLTIEALGYYVNIKDTRNERMNNMEMQLSLEEIQMIMDNMGPEAVPPEAAQPGAVQPEAVQPEVIAETVSQIVNEEPPVMPEIPAVENVLPMPEIPAVEGASPIPEAAAGEESAVILEMPTVGETAAMPEIPATEEPAVILEMPAADTAPVIPDIPAVEAEPVITDIPIVDESAVIPDVPVMEEAMPVPEMAVAESASAIPDMPVLDETPVIPDVTVADEIPAISDLPVSEETAAMSEIPIAEEELPMLEISASEEEPTVSELSLEEEIPVADTAPAAEEIPVADTAPAAEEIPIMVEEIPIMAEEDAVTDEVSAEPEITVTENETPAVTDITSSSPDNSSSRSNLKFMNKEPGKSAFCAEIDGTFLGAGAGTKNPVMIAGNNIIYVTGNSLVTQNICTGERRDYEMEEMILFLITQGMQNNIEENRTYAKNSLLFKWLVSKLLCLKTEENAITEINDYFDFIQIGITAVCEGGNITFKTSDGNELYIINLFEKISTIRA